MNVKLFTVGYEGIVPEEFIKKLKKNGIKMLLDVREIPASRKKDFSKSNLQSWMKTSGIDYLHIKELGSPKTIRDELRATKNFIKFYEKYLAYLKSQTETVENIEKIVSEQPACLLCFERDANVCHRSIIAKYLKKQNSEIQVIHL